MDDFKVTIIGAGVIGLAIAYYLSKSLENILVIEKEDTYGCETSSRNSEVIHASIYYPQNSPKAKLCVKNRRLIYDFLRKHDLPFKKIGKLIVASKDEENELIKLYEQGVRNEVEGLSIIDSNKIKDMDLC